MGMSEFVRNLKKEERFMGANDRITGPFPTALPQAEELVVTEPKQGDRVEVITGSTPFPGGERESVYQYGQVVGDCTLGSKYDFWAFTVDTTYRGILVNFDTKKIGDYGTQRPLSEVSQRCVAPTSARVVKADE